MSDDRFAGIPRVELVGDPFADAPVRSLAAELAPLADRAWEIHSRVAAAADEGCGVRASIPILFFGDVSAYWWSPCRVVTVGLNPSDQEFPTASPWLRFPSGAEILHERRAGSTETDGYLELLSAYFDEEPYRKWFDRSFEPLLRGIGASYYEGAASVAVHTDLASPVATSPTWSGLDSREKELHSGGAELWRELVDLLAPDVSVLSVAENLLASAALPPLAEWEQLTRVEENRRDPYVVYATTMPVAGGRKVALVIHGRCVNVPFGNVSFSERARIGAAVAARLDEGRARGELGVL